MDISDDDDEALAGPPGASVVGVEAAAAESVVRSADNGCRARIPGRGRAEAQTVRRRQGGAIRWSEPGWGRLADTTTVRKLRRGNLTVRLGGDDGDRERRARVCDRCDGRQLPCCLGGKMRRCRIGPRAVA
jgi:hypothetical protein